MDLLDHIACPYCGVKYLDRTQYPHDLQCDGDSDMFDCGQCGRRFSVTIRATLAYEVETLESVAAANAMREQQEAKMAHARAAHWLDVLHEEARKREGGERT